jgi:hypothetical protein
MNNPNPRPQFRSHCAAAIIVFAIAIATLSGCDMFFAPSRQPHSVVYEGNGNSSGLAPADLVQHYEGDAVAAAFADGLVKTGHTFMGWNTAEDGTGSAYSPGVLFSMPNRELRLFATWSRSLHSVSFDSRGGTGLAAVRTERIAEIPSSSKPGFALDGWYADSECSPARKVAFPYLPDADATLFAKWIPASEGLLYVLTPEGYSVTKGMAHTYGRIVIPEYWLGRPVTTLGYAAFADCEGLTEVQLPPGMRLIEDRAFYNCPGLLRVSVPESLKSVGAYAFSDCLLLRALPLPIGVTSIGDGAFYGCRALESFAIPPALRTIGSRVFSYCRSLTTLDIPPGVDSLGNYAFSNCYNLKTLNIPDSVSVIGKGAFDGCEALESLTIPQAVSLIADWTFFDCIALKAIVLPRATRSIGYAALGDCSSLTELSIPENVASIGEYAISECDSLLAVDVYPLVPPAAGAYLFEACGSLAVIRVPASSLAAYKAAPEWSAHSSIIVAR